VFVIVEMWRFDEESVWTWAFTCRISYELVIIGRLRRRDAEARDQRGDNVRDDRRTSGFSGHKKVKGEGRGILRRALQHIGIISRPAIQRIAVCEGVAGVTGCDSIGCDIRGRCESLMASTIRGVTEGRLFNRGMVPKHIFESQRAENRRKAARAFSCAIFAMV